MPAQIHPIDPAGHSLEHHLSQHSKRSQAIYVTIVLFLMAAIAALPLIRVDVSVQSGGILRPTTEKHEVRVRMSGVAERLLVRDGQRVQQGQPMLLLQTGEVEHEGELLSARLAEKTHALADLKRLTRANVSQVASGTVFLTQRYAQEHAELVHTLRPNELKQRKAESDVARTRMLVAKELVPQIDLEEQQFQLSSLRVEADLLREQFLTRWQAELAAAHLALAELRSQQEHLREAGQQHVVTAPVAGTVEQLARLAAGSFLQTGEGIAVISPNSALLAELYVSPRDVGLLRMGMPCRMHVDAFNYTNWGYATGRIAQISEDYLDVENEPMFRVRCTLEQDHLTLRNGFRGRLTKGMTLRARFVVANRSLLQLLRDDVNDWLHPINNPAAVATR